MNNYTAGHVAEKTAAEYLKAHGYKIVELNWRTKYCEIDVVAEKDKTIYFVEVKYRQTNKQGYGVEYVTAKKLKQMRFAAEMWIQNHDWKGECQLAAVSIDNDTFSLVEITN